MFKPKYVSGRQDLFVRVSVRSRVGSIFGFSVWHALIIQAKYVETRHFSLRVDVVLVYNGLVMKGEENNELNFGKAKWWVIFGRQVKNPLLLILSVATVISFSFGQHFDALVILGMISLSVGLGFWNEYRAEKTMEDLLAKISFTATVIRNGVKQSVQVKDIVVGDEVSLYPGSVVPADLKLTQEKSLEINEAVISGESMPVHKGRGDRMAYMGTIVSAGTGTGVVVAIGKKTKFGQISESVSNTKPETEFQKGLRGFGTLLVRVISVMGLIIFGVNMLLGRSLLDAALFALSVAIGLTPELLPVVVTVSLSHGAKRLAKKDVIVKQLVAIEDLGNMEVLCSDKTGTLTEGKLHLISHQDSNGKEDDLVLKFGLICNSAVVHHRIFGDAIDAAIWEHAKEQVYTLDNNIEKVAEQPFDFEHRGMFSVISDEGKRSFLFKGAPDRILEGLKVGKEQKGKLKLQVDNWYQQGYRVIGIAKKAVSNTERYTFSDAKEMTLVGWMLFSDPPKPGAKKAIDKLERMGVILKIVTGDNEVVTKKVCIEVDVPCNKVMTGPELDKMSDDELNVKVWDYDVFARMTPDKKLRIIKALKRGGHTVGYIGDGINDAPSLHEADAGISVNSAVDVAKDTASIVLLRKSLDVVAEGIEEGRRTFSNTIKYILMGTSSNFGNMFSMAGASFILPFLPMSPSQILLANSMYDVSQLSVPTDNVDHEQLLRPNKWDIKMIGKYMLFFGPISSIYDFMTFGVMYFVFSARGALFQTGWFVESLVTEIMVIFVIRTNRSPFWSSKPSWQLVATCFGMVGLGLALPFSPLAKWFELVKLPFAFFVILLAMTITYLGLVEWGKKAILKRL